MSVIIIDNVMRIAVAKPTCAERVWDGKHGSPVPCRRKGVVQHGDKWYCQLHAEAATKPTKGKKAMDKKPGCSEGVFDGWRSYPCRRKGIVQHGGKWYCRQHSPDAVAARRTKRNALWEAEAAVGSAEIEARTARTGLVQHCILHIKDLPPSVHKATLAVRDTEARLTEARIALAKLKENK